MTPEPSQRTVNVERRQAKDGTVKFDIVTTFSYTGITQEQAQKLINDTINPRRP